jgi:nitrite reductase/ring-hydroxylating ferredoxin subunit
MSVDSLHHVGRVGEFQDGTRRFVVINGLEVGVLRHRGEFHAFANVCPHQGGPVCEGAIFDRVTEIVDADRKLRGSLFIEEEPHIVCPWHGVEFDLASGACPVEPTMRLRRFDVQVDGDVVSVVA